MDRQFTITVFLFISHPPPPPRSPHELRVIFLNFASIYYSLSSSRDTWSKCFCKIMLGEALTLSQGSSVYDNGEKSLRNLRSLCMCWLQPPPPVFCRSTSEQQEIPESYDKSAHFAPAYERSVTISATARQNISVRPSRKSVEDWHST